MKKVPMRMCVVTREKLPKNELVRVVNTENGVIVDLTGKVIAIYENGTEEICEKKHLKNDLWKKIVWKNRTSIEALFLTPSFFLVRIYILNIYSNIYFYWNCCRSS